MRKFKEGEDHYIWDHHHGLDKECLANATLQACDNCGKPATVNSVWVANLVGQEEAIKEATELKETYGLLTELGADSEGSAFCENCYGKHAVQEA